MGKDTRTLAELKHHYDVETLLADKLRSAGSAQRRTLYNEVYDELCRLVPNHPMLVAKVSEQGLMAKVRRELQFLRRFLTAETVFMEIGAGDCSLSIEVAKHVRQVYAVEVCEAITRGVCWPQNAKLIITDGTAIPVPDGSVTVAYSNQVMEHLHPDDAMEQLLQVHRALKPAGCYVCITPNALNGPHDISRLFDQVARGFHMREYTFRELETMFRRAGFRRVLKYVGGRGLYLRMPGVLARSCESVFGRLPFHVRRAAGSHLPCNAILALRLTAVK